MFNIKQSQLGKTVKTPEKYNPELLFRIPSANNRIKYGISVEKLPFIGVDTWNCYEVSFMTDNGLPVSRILKIVFDAENEYLIESKSLKLYLNSLNFSHLGKTVAEATKNVEKLILSDLRKTLDTEKITLKLFAQDEIPKPAFINVEYVDFISLADDKELINSNFTFFKEDKNLLKGILQKGKSQEYAFRTDILRSNCPVTNQPDWGDLFVRIKTDYKIDFQSVIAYIISLRKENHFHEEVVEMIYKHLSSAFLSEKLLVAAMYTRRGGIDINPIRVSCIDWLETAFTDVKHLISKTWRQ